MNLPDYLEVIKAPMDLTTIGRKVDSGEYASPDQFVADMRLVFRNAMTYNHLKVHLIIVCSILTRDFLPFYI